MGYDLVLRSGQGSRSSWEITMLMNVPTKTETCGFIKTKTASSSISPGWTISTIPGSFLDSLFGNLMNYGTRAGSPSYNSLDHWIFRIFYTAHRDPWDYWSHGPNQLYHQDICRNRMLVS